MPQLGDGETLVTSFYLIVFAVICASVYSSTHIRYVRFLSLATTWAFLGLIVVMWAGAFMGEGSNVGEFVSTISLLGGYFGNLDKFVLPLNDYHEFYLYWWFAWSIMIGQFTSRFVGGLRTYQVLAAMLVIPSLPIAAWFAVLYYYSVNSIDTSGFYNLAMAIVGITFVINSLDSLVRLYTDNIGMTVKKLGTAKYLVGNIVVLSLLTLLFKLDFLQIQWVGAVVIGLFFSCFGYILVKKFKAVKAIDCSSSANQVDFHRIDLVD
jgi:choline-glycine betaine transporter